MSQAAAYVDDEAEVMKARDEALRELGLAAAVEAVRAQRDVRRRRKQVVGERPAI